MKSNMSAHIDYKKFDMINQMITKINKAEDFTGVIEHALKDITKVVHCRVG